MRNEIEKLLNGMWLGILILFAILLFNLFSIQHHQAKALENIQKHFILIERELKIIK
jgi:hypothetical protein